MRAPALGVAEYVVNMRAPALGVAEYVVNMRAPALGDLGMLGVRFVADAFDSRCARAGVRRPDSQDESADGVERALWKCVVR